MLHLTFMTDFTVSNNSFQSSAYPIPYLQNLNALLLKSNSSYFFPILIAALLFRRPLYPNSVIMTALKLIYPKTVLS